MPTKPTVGPAPDGFTAPDVALPFPRCPLDREARDRLARIVLGIQRGLIPEEFVAGVGAEKIEQAMATPLGRAEAYAWADMIAAAVEGPLCGVLPGAEAL